MTRAIEPETVTISLPKGALGGWDILIGALERARAATSLHLTFGSLIEQMFDLMSLGHRFA